MPHTGIEIPDALAGGFVSPWLARRDTDWWVDRLYDFAEMLGATVVHTAISRSVIDVNRDPLGTSLYPGQVTTELCPTTTFDGEPLYVAERLPDAEAIAWRLAQYHAPYHAALSAEITRLRALHAHVVVYDCHSIRSRISRLFAGELPHINIGTHDGASCAPKLSAAVEHVCAASEFSYVLNGRFKGGYITRHYGRPENGVHAIQIELACRGYLREPPAPITDARWPVTFDDAYAAGLRGVLRRILEATQEFAAKYRR
jgi:formiminoglutamase